MNASWIFSGLSVLAWASPLAAQPTARMSLTWNAPSGCPTAENVQARVDALLGGEASASSVADVRASGQVERVDSGFRLLLNMGIAGTPHSRAIEARSCDELAGAAAIAIALLARSTLSGDSTEPSASTTPGSASAPAASAENPPPAVESPPSPDKPSPSEPTPAESPSARARFVIDAPIGLVGTGSLPSTAFGLGAALGIRWKALRAVARGELWAPQKNEVSGFSAHFAMQSARAEACLVQPLGGVELGPCLGSAVQRVAADGIGSWVLSPSSRTAVWFSGLAGIFASLPTPSFAPLRFFGEASVLVSPARPRFVIDQFGPIHEPPLAAIRVDLGCEWIF